MNDFKPIQTRCQFVGCRRYVRKCYHCGYKVEMIVVDGVTPNAPSPDDFCISKRHHDQNGILTWEEIKYGMDVA